MTDTNTEAAIENEAAHRQINPESDQEPFSKGRQRRLVSDH